MSPSGTECNIVVGACALQGTRNPARFAVLRVDRHVVIGLRVGGAVSRLAALSGCVRVRSAPVHHRRPGTDARSTARRGRQDRPILQSRRRRRVEQTNRLATESMYIFCSLNRYETFNDNGCVIFLTPALVFDTVEQCTRISQY